MPIPIHILVVDDDEVIRDACNQLLSGMKFDVKLAVDGNDVAHGAGVAR